MAPRTSQQTFAGNEKFAAPSRDAGLPQVERRQTPEKASRSGTVKATADYRVLLSLADVTPRAIESSLGRVTSLELESALETIGSGKASSGAASAVEAAPSGSVPSVAEPIAKEPDPRFAARVRSVPTRHAAMSYASLLAASPAYHSAAGQREEIECEIPQHVSPQVNRIPARFDNTRGTVPQSPGDPEPTSAYESPPAGGDSPTESKSASATNRATEQRQRRFDRTPVKPIRRPFRVYRPAWLPEVPPSLLLGLLICFSALLVGMLWRGHRSELSSPLGPEAIESHAGIASEEDGKPQTPRVAEVPEAVKAPATPVPPAEPPLKTAQQPDTKKTASKKKPTAQATTVANNEAKQEATTANLSPANASPVATAETQATNAETQATNATPSSGSVQQLPRVEIAPAGPVYGQYPGEPSPHFVENPHANGSGPVLQARRPAAEFQGMITKPDATQPYERY